MVTVVGVQGSADAASPLDPWRLDAKGQAVETFQTPAEFAEPSVEFGSLRTWIFKSDKVARLCARSMWNDCLTRPLLILDVQRTGAPSELEAFVTNAHGTPVDSGG